MTAAPIARRTRRTRRPASPTSPPAPRSAPRASSRALRTGSLVGGRGLCPQVEFGAVSLDLPPYGSQAERHDGQHDQLLHSVLPLPVLTTALGSHLVPGSHRAHPNPEQA